MADPGVESVREIYGNIKGGDYKTKIMAASFRSTNQIIELAGCDNLTISPELLEELSAIQVPVERKLMMSDSSKVGPHEIIAKSEFDKAMAENVMATELLTTGIRRFAEDATKLKSWLKTIDRPSS